MYSINQPKHHFSYPTYALVHARNWFEAHPKAIRHAAKVIILGLVGFTLLNAGIFTVQKSRTPAFIKIGGQSYGNIAISDAKQKMLEQYSSIKITAKYQDKAISFEAEKAGVKINPDKTLSVITERRGWQRIPIISTIHNLFLSLKPVYDVDKEVLAAKLAPSIANETVLPVDANIAVPSNAKEAVKILPEVTGRDMNAALAAEELAIAIQKGNFAIEISPKVIDARWTAADVEKFMPAVNAARDTSLTIESDGKKLIIDPGVLAPMLKLKTDGSVLKLTLDQEKLKAYLDQQATTFYVASIAAKATLRDGSEISRVAGQEGQKLDTAETAALATTAFENGVLSVTPKLATVSPETLITKTYSNTSSGLYKIIEDFAASHKGIYRVAAVEVNGSSNRSAFYNADSSVITASTFKLFVAYGILQDIENGKITMNTATSEGSVGDCMYKMIHISDNECAAALQSLLGYNSFQARLKADGMPNSYLITDSSDKRSTARDEMTLLTKLYNHELINESSLQYLFGLMENQIYRSGIPAGSQGAVVADKVGMLYALNHDIGIVYAPKATYALVILTDGAGGWTNVRLLSEQIYDFYNQ